MQSNVTRNLSLRDRTYFPGLGTDGTFCRVLSRCLKSEDKIHVPRFFEPDYRSNQNYVGETLARGKEKIHFACPKQEDLTDLMEGYGIDRGIGFPGVLRQDQESHPGNRGHARPANRPLHSVPHPEQQPARGAETRMIF